ncbi:MAG: hypothetical protein ABSH05_26085 [Bryobacteraceae bacterium]|jgi:hypothetical protein
MGELAPGLIWIAMPMLIAGAAALVTALMMQARAELIASRHRETLAEARALLATQHRAMEERIRATEETARRKALDEFMADIQVEEREYVRESPSLFSKRKSLVVQQRVCFRNVPLTDWVEREYPGTTEMVRVPLRSPQAAIEAPPATPAVEAVAETTNGRRLLGEPTSPSTASDPPPAAGTRRRSAVSGAAAGRW